MTKYLSLLISGLLGVTAINSCGKSRQWTPLEERLNTATEKLEILPTGFTALHYVKDQKVLGSILSASTRRPPGLLFSYYPHV